MTRRLCFVGSRIPRKAPTLVLHRLGSEDGLALVLFNYLVICILFGLATSLLTLASIESRHAKVDVGAKQAFWAAEGTTDHVIALLESNRLPDVLQIRTWTESRGLTPLGSASRSYSVFLEGFGESGGSTPQPSTLTTVRFFAEPSGQSQADMVPIRLSIQAKGTSGQGAEQSAIVRGIRRGTTVAFEHVLAANRILLQNSTTAAVDTSAATWSLGRLLGELSRGQAPPSIGGGILIREFSLNALTLGGCSIGGDIEVVNVPPGRSALEAVRFADNVGATQTQVFGEIKNRDTEQPPTWQPIRLNGAGLGDVVLSPGQRLELPPGRYIANSVIIDNAQLIGDSVSLVVKRSLVLRGNSMLAGLGGVPNKLLILSLGDVELGDGHGSTIVAAIYAPASSVRVIGRPGERVALVGAIAGSEVEANHAWLLYDLDLADRQFQVGWEFLMKLWQSKADN